MDKDSGKLSQTSDLLDMENDYQKSDIFGHSQAGDNLATLSGNDNGGGGGNIAGKMQQTSSSSTDDFEHVEHELSSSSPDEKLFGDFSSGNQKLNEFEKFTSEVQPITTESFIHKYDDDDLIIEKDHKDKTSMFDDLMSNFDDAKKTANNEFTQFASTLKEIPSKFDNFGKVEEPEVISVKKQVLVDNAESLRNFMDAERNSAKTSPERIPKKAASLLDEIEDDYLNPYSTGKHLSESSEKFISSEDLIATFTDSIPTTTKITPSAPSVDLYEANKKPIDSFVETTKKNIPEPIIPMFDPEVPKIEKKPEIIKNVEPEPIVKPEISYGDLIKEIEEPIIKEKSPPIKPPTKINDNFEIKNVLDDHSKVEEIITSTKKPITPSVSSSVSTKKTQEMISAEEMFCRIGLDAWFKPDRLHPKVESLIYWRDTKKSGIVFGIGLAILLAISCFSVISVFAYVSLLALVATISFRIYKNVLQAVQKTSEGHPFKEYLEFDLTLSQDKVQQVISVAVAHFNATMAELRRLFLVEDLIDSIKFGLLLWCLTYLGSWFNGMTLVIIAFVALFTLPKVYENNKQSIDTYLDLVRSKILEVTDKVKTAVPIGKKQESEKDK